MLENGHCAHCLLSLGLGPRMSRIVLHITQHPEWENDPTLGRIIFRVVGIRGRDPTRIAVKIESVEQITDVA